MKTYILNKHIRFRKESGYILICDCERLLDYEVPLEFYELLSLLKKGSQLRRQGIIKELQEIGIVEEKGKERTRANEDIFSKLGYDENEFV